MIKTLNEILRASPDMTYNEAVKVQKDMRVALENEAAGFKTSTVADVSGIDDLLKSDFNTATATGFQTSPGVCISAALKKDLQQNRPLTDTMDERAYYELKNENERLKKRVQEAEGEMTIVKGIGMNSPEMKASQARVKELENSLSISLETNDKYQRDNKVLTTENDNLRDELQALKLSRRPF